MNVGQILETHLGWAAKNVGWRLQEMLEKNFGRISSEEAEEGVRRLRGLRAAGRAHRGAAGAGAAELAAKLKEGMHVATPVFDGAHEDEMKALLGEAGDDAVDPLRRPHR